MSVALATFGAVQAAVFQCPSGDVECLIASINTANGNGEDDTITLRAGTYRLTVVDNTTNGNNGLPSVTSPITIQGTGVDRTIIERGASAPFFRILHVDAEGALQLEGLTLRGGVAEDIAPEPPPFAFNGGGILNFGEVRITNSRLTGNRGAAEVGTGGGLANHGGAVTIAQSVVADNRADAGGGLASFDGTVQISESSFLDNAAGHPGGAIWNCGGTATIATSTFARNVADGAAIANGSNCVGGTMTIVSTTIADSFGNSVGGIFNSGTMLVLDSAIVRNTPSFGVGGILNAGTLTLMNTTIAANSAAGDFGGIDNLGDAVLTLINTTVADNAGEGLVNFSGGTAVLVNTLLARNTSEEGVADCVGSVTSLGHNLIGDPTGCTITLQPSDLTGPPGLGRLVDDGTPGHAHLPLLASSQAINSGDDEVCPPTDQLGQPRVGICDIGAIEFQSEVEVVEIDIKQGRAERLGTTNAKVTLEGRVTGPPLADIDLGASTVTITSVINEAGVELVAGTSLPLTLEARPGSDADGATFETPGRARPKFRLDLSHRGEEVVSFRLVVEFAPSQKPSSCAGTPRTTELTTSFQLDPGPVSVTATEPWQCLAGDSQLRVPVP